MSDGIEIPITIPDADRTLLAITAIRDSFKGVERQAITLAGKTDEGAKAFEQLAKDVADGKKSLDDVRAVYASIAAQVPRATNEVKKANEAARDAARANKEAEQAARAHAAALKGEAVRAAKEAEQAARAHTAALKELEKAEKDAYTARMRELRELDAANQKTKEAAAEFLRLAAATEKAAKEAHDAARPWNVADRAVRAFGEGAKSAWEGLSKFGESYRNVREPVMDFVEGVREAATEVTRLATEQSRLDRVQNGLGVSLQQAQDYAGGFAEQTEIATAALTLQGQGIRVNQQELDALARLSMRRAQDTGRDLHDVLENLTEAVTEGGEEFGKVAPELLAVADSSHTAGERLAAMVEVANRVGPATRSAADDFARYTAAVEASQRQLATGFTEELVHLQQISPIFDNATNDAEEFGRSVRAIGNAAAYTATYIITLAQSMIGLIGTGLLALARIASLAPGSPIDSDDVDSLGADLSAWTERRMQAFNNLGEQGGDNRTSADPGTSLTLAGAARNRLLRGTTNNALGGQADMTFTAAEANASDMTFSQGETGLFGRRGGGRRRRTLAQLMDSAAGGRGLPFTGDSDPDADLAVVTNRGTFTESEDTALAARKAAEQAATAGRIREREREAGNARAEFQRRRDADADARSNSGRLREYFRQQASAAVDMASTVTSAYDQMTNAASSHFEALVLGQETAGEALQGFVSDTLKALAKIAAQQAIFELGKGFAALFLNPAEAAAHFGAAALFGVVAAGAGLAAQAVAPSDKGRAAGGASTGSRDREAANVNGRSSPSGGTQVINVMFGGPVYGSGGVRQAGRELAGVLNRGAVQGGTLLNPLLIPQG